MFWNLSDIPHDEEELQERIHHWLWQRKNCLLPPIKQNQLQKQLYICIYAKLGRGSKGFHIKVYEHNFDSKLSVKFNEIKFKDVFQYHYGQTLNFVKIMIREVSHAELFHP